MEVLDHEIISADYTSHSTAVRSAVWYYCQITEKGLVKPPPHLLPVEELWISFFNNNSTIVLLACLYSLLTSL